MLSVASKNNSIAKCMQTIFYTLQLEFNRIMVTDTLSLWVRCIQAKDEVKKKKQPVRVQLCTAVSSILTQHGTLS